MAVITRRKQELKEAINSKVGRGSTQKGTAVESMEAQGVHNWWCFKERGNDADEYVSRKNRI